VCVCVCVCVCVRASVCSHSFFSVKRSREQQRLPLNPIYHSFAVRHISPVFDQICHLGISYVITRETGGDHCFKIQTAAAYLSASRDTGRLALSSINHQTTNQSMDQYKVSRGPLGSFRNGVSVSKPRPGKPAHCCDSFIKSYIGF